MRFNTLSRKIHEGPFPLLQMPPFAMITKRKHYFAQNSTSYRCHKFQWMSEMIDYQKQQAGP